MVLRTHAKYTVCDLWQLVDCSKDALKPDEEITDEEMIDTGASEEDTETDDRRLNFSFYKSKGGYIYNPTYNE